MSMDRAHFVAELLALWQDSASQMQEEGFIVAADEIRSAIHVLEKTFSASELGVEAVTDKELLKRMNIDEFIFEISRCINGTSNFPWIFLRDELRRRLTGEP